MSVKSSSTRRTVTETVLSQQSRSYKNPNASGFVITGGAVNNQTLTYIDTPTVGLSTSYSQTSGGTTGPVITGITYLDVDGQPSAAVQAVSTNGGNILITGTGFNSADTVYINNVQASKTFVNSTAIYATVTAGAVGNLSLALFNSQNIGSLSNSSVRLSGAPTWVTTVAITVYNGMLSNISLEASGDSTLSYSLKSGSGNLPTGLSLISTGYLSGTVTGYTVDSVVTFTLLVSDQQGQAAQRSFNLTILLGDTYFPQTTLLLQGDVGTTFISDASTNNFLITRNGDTRPSRLSPYWPGGWSAYFDGTGDFLTVPHSTALNLSSGDFTIEGWFYCTALTAGTQQILNKDGVINVSYPSYAVAINSSGNFILNLGNGAGLNPTITTYTGSVITTNTWNHFACIKTGTTIRIYQNGIQTVSTSQGIAITDGGKAVYIGSYNGAASGDSMTGYISNIRILKGTVLYTANFTPSTTSLTTVANTSLLTLRDAILADDSPNNFTITRIGDTRLTTFSPFNTTPHTVTANTNSVYFDGTGDYLTIDNNINLRLDNDFTIEFWFYPITTTFAGLAQYRNGAAWSSGDFQFHWDSNTVTFYTPNGSVATDTMPIKVWNHIAISRSGSTISAYLNGVRSNTWSNSTVYTGNGGLFRIGELFDGTHYYFNGYISNFRMVSGTAVYTANFTPPTTALTAITNTILLTCQNTTIIDNSTNNFTITRNGDASPSAVNPFGETVAAISNYTWSANTYGASAYFDGTGDYLTVPDNASLDMGSSDLTMECWYYPTSTPNGGLLYKRANTSTYAGVNISFGNKIQPSLLVTVDGSTWGIATDSSVGVTIGAWNHIAVTRSGNTWRIFVNGVLGLTSTLSGTVPDNAAAFSIGAGAADGGQPITASYISNVRVLKGTALYTTAFIPPTAPLTAVANTSLLTLQSDTGSNSVQFVDQSPNNHLITRNGNASQGSYSPLNPTSWSAYFDGSGDYVSLPSAFNGAMGNGWAGGLHTVECWIYPTTWNSANSYYHGIYGTYAAVAANGRWHITVLGQAGNAAGKLNFSYTTSASAQVDRPSTSFNIPLNTWTHIAVTIDASTSSSSTVKFFVNGTLTDTFTAQNLSSQTGNYTAPNIGGNMSQYVNDFVGYISNFRHSYNSLIYTANFTPPTATLQPVSTTAILAFSGPRLITLGPGQFELTRAGDTRIVPFGPHSPSAYTPRGYGIYFDGAGDYLTMPSAAATQFTMGTGDFTIEMWINIASLASTRTLFDSNNNGDSNGVGRLGLWVTTGGVIQLFTTTGSVLTSGGSIKVNNWYHVAYSRESGSGRLFVNGVQVNSTYSDSTNYTCGNTNRPVIGINGFDSSSNPMFGVISNLRIVKGVAVYNTNFTVSSSALSAVANTSVLTGHTTSITDGSSNALTITVNGNAGPVNLNPFGFDVTTGVSYNPSTMGGSAYFDGSGDDLQTAAGSATAIIGGTLTATRTFTIDCWVYHNAYTSGSIGVVIGDMLITAGTNYWSFGTNSSGQVVLYWYDGASKSATGNTVIPLYAWAHIAISVSAGTIRLFVNGQIQTITGTGTLTTTTGSLGYLAIGRFNTSTVFNGYISNLRILNGEALYTTSFLLPTTVPLLSSTTSLLLPFTNSGIVDSSGRNVVETVADARVVTSTKKYSTGSYYFDGTGDYLTIPYNERHALEATDFTLEAWIYRNTTGAEQNIAITRSSAGQDGWNLRINANNTLQFYYTGGSIVTSTGTIPATTWTHVAVARSGTTCRLFINGIVDGSATFSNGTTNTQPLRIGVDNTNAAFYFNGYIDDFRITRGYARYTANFTPPGAEFINK